MARVLLLALSISVLGAPACTFERRLEPGAEDPQRELVPEGLSGLGEESAIETVRLFRESVAVGDLSLALVLLDGEATIADELVGEASEPRTRGELLLALRRRHAAGLAFETFEEPSVAYAGAGVLVVSHLGLREGGPDAVVRLGAVYESVLLVPDPAGWRIRHLHRSFLPETVASPAL